MSDLNIRPAGDADLSAINDIYNHYVLHSTSTYQETPEPLEGRQEWFAAHGESHPITVATLEGVVVGWGSLSPYHRRSAFRYTVENSVYVRPDRQRHGIGSALLADLIERATALGYHSIIAAIDGEQAPSIALHAKFGFTHAGVLREAGLKFGRWLDVVYMQKTTGASDQG
jgi:phosphinothricin acetyltransferase